VSPRNMRQIVLLVACCAGVAAFQPSLPRTHLRRAAVTVGPVAHAPVPFREAMPCRAAGPVMLAPVVAEKDFKLAVVLLVLGPTLLFAPWLFGGFFTLLGLLIAVQTLRVRFVFDEDAFEVKAVDISEAFNAEAALNASGENFAVGGENRWKYESFVNWEFFPSEDLPVLVYFKETETPSDKWDVGPGKWANSEDAKAKGAVAGQVHFFPCIASAAFLKEQFVARGCAKL